jgi:choline dehydrogenase-like flavoprotein
VVAFDAMRVLPWLRGIMPHLQLLLCWVSIAASLSSNSNISSNSKFDNATFDFIIAGGGLSGLVVANRLSENSNCESLQLITYEAAVTDLQIIDIVLVVENGYLDKNYKTDVPYATTVANPADMWNISSAPETWLNNETFTIWVGSVVGGGSIINGMACTRGSAGDYDAWERLGNPGWGWDGLFPYFLKSTNYTPPLPEIAEEYDVTWNSSVWGDGGPVQVGHASTFFPDTKVVRASWIESGARNLTDGGDGDSMGLSWLPTDMDTKTGTRSSARAAYYEPYTARPNLHLLTGHRVTEIIFDDGNEPEARGVVIQSREDNSTMKVFADKEVVLAAGAILTPHLLQLSGLGPKDILEAANVTVKKDMPAIGSNFQDHPVVYMSYNISNQSFPDPMTVAKNATFNETAWEQYMENRTGPYTSGLIGYNGNSALYFTLPGVVNDHEELIGNITSQHALDYLPERYAENTALLKGFEAQRSIVSELLGQNQSSCCELIPSIVGSATASLQKPLSRGTITLDPANPGALPIVHFNTLMNPVDASMIVSMVRKEREHWSLPELARYSPVEDLPGVEYHTDEEILAGSIAAGIVRPSFAHSSGSCPMMPEELGGCVGSDLRVYGTRKLSIVDASILPIIPGTHLQMTMYAVAEKAADIIKARH